MPRHPAHPSPHIDDLQTRPQSSQILLVGIDRFMSECRALTNLIGNGVATIVVNRWEKELDKEVLNAKERR